MKMVADASPRLKIGLSACFQHADPTRPLTPAPRPRSAAPRSLIARAPTPERLPAVPRITPRSRSWLPLVLSLAALVLGTWLLMSIFDLAF